MAVRRPGSYARRLALPLRAWLARFSYLLLIGLCLALVAVAQWQPAAATAWRMRALDTLRPLLLALASPVQTIQQIGADWASYLALRGENLLLREQIALLQQQQQQLLPLAAENRQLRDLLRHTPEPGLAFVTARVLGSGQTSWQHSMLVAAGTADGVQPGQAVMGQAGVLGRVVATGEHTARVLLLSDAQSRIPVLLEQSRARAILAGQGGRDLRLLYLPDDIAPASGERVLSSGDGGIFPPGLPVAGILSDGATARLLAPLDRMDVVQIVAFRRDPLLTVGE